MPAMTAPLGAHVSIAGGMSRAIERGEALDCRTIQVFVKNASQWKGKILSDQEVNAFTDAHAISRIGTVVAHATYLINPAATNDQNLHRSKATLSDELERCERLGIMGLVLHPGAHLGAGIDSGIARVAQSLQEVLDTAAAATARILLEVTAGQGTVMGFEIEHLARIRDLSQRQQRIGLCLDTCHAFAAGYPLHEDSAYRDLFSEIRDRFGPSEPSCIHLNDSRFGLGSRRDRHANLGEGEIPIELFARLITDPTLQEVPMILETPLGDDGDGHRRDLETLRSLAQ